MKKFIHIVLLSLAMAGCATRPPPPMLYDLGPLPAAPDGAAIRPALPPISVADVQAPAWLDSQMMYFRLGYANDQQPRPYAGSRWIMPPALLFGQRLKSRLAQAGGVVLPASDGAVNIPSLHMEADDFTQIFSSAENSTSRVTIRASVLNGRTLVAQQTFMRQASAPSADAAGGARALAAAGDAVIADMIEWLAGLPIKK